ncbi:MAG: lipid-A-disaccharide synthase [Candidatus Kapabacteria bacterium]|nr:lipid-A-disaccharide synthase [Candidatus Kapabacteria bacterium]
MKTIFISAGDPSGDRHASKLMQTLAKSYLGDLHFIGIGGPEMQKQGLEAIVDFNELNVVGFWEVAKKYSFFTNLLKKAESILQNGHVDLFLPIDYPGFNLRLSEKTRKLSIPVLYYIAPQLWAWGSGRISKIRDYVSELLVVFPFEEKFFRDLGINCTFVGHPLIDSDEFNTPAPALADRDNIIAFFPGSRKIEIARHIELCTDIKNLLKPNLKDFRFIVSIPSQQKHYYQNKIKHDFEISENSVDLMKKAKAGLVKTGTTTLESALSAMPFLMYYKASILTYYIGKTLYKLDYLSLPNILENKNVVQEFIQTAAKPNIMAAELIKLIKKPELSQIMVNDFSQIRKNLGKSGAALNAANAIVKFL